MKISKLELIEKVGGRYFILVSFIDKKLFRTKTFTKMVIHEKTTNNLFSKTYYVENGKDFFIDGINVIKSFIALDRKILIINQDETN